MEFPSAAQLSVPLHKITTLTAAAGAQFIFEEELLFSQIQFIFNKAADTPNTGNVELHVRDIDTGNYTKFRTFAPGETWNWTAPQQGVKFGLRSFKIKVASDGDGVHVAVA